MINWFTVGAQIVNFLILVGLLKHFLYGPIVKAMDDRDSTIKTRLKEADDKREEAEKRSSEYEQKSKDLDERKEQLLAEARDRADEDRKKRIRKARDDADAMSKEWRTAVEREKDAFLDDIRRQLSRQAVAIARKLLADLAGSDVEGLMVDRFISRLEDMDNEERKAFKQAIESESGKVVARSGLDLGEDERTRLTQAVRERMGVDASLEFDQTDDVVAGIEISAGGRKLAWTVAQHLDAAATEVRKSLEEAGNPSPSDEPDKTTSDGNPDKQAPDAEEQQNQEADQDAESHSK
jgi:F-type H+-transporting ATPase subunit b